ncbi:MAG: hypothetical protein K9J12_16515 [Melioribacteraceae bacterium]|nr:hypothetical protein [Melioribacteraceae bacterium]MCF8263348.1 hypothetical protein [Melioribacteraceae bacterium]MCF8430790.1 hypothetical protein [Melioribacteraceae bacterium]
MIKFFRKIRQKLLSENKFSNYLIYALGEIVLVVIGILIALQINNANEIKKIELRNSKNLNSLLEELKSNKVIITKNMNTVRNQISNSLHHIDSLSNPDYEIADLETYFLHSQNDLGPISINSVATTSLSELVSSGGYSEIASDSIKRSVSEYQSQLNDLDKRISAFETYWNNIELPYTMDHHSLLDMWLKGQHVDLKETERQIARKLPNFKRNISYFHVQIDAYKNNRTYANMYVIRFFELSRILGSIENLDNSVDKLTEKIIEVVEE